MARLSQEEVDILTRKYLDLKEKAEKDPSVHEAEFKKFQNYCVEKLKYLVLIRSAKYKKFSNYPDLTQDGFEALISAFDSFEPEKGCFTWWADKYISTKISRSANAHSTIRIPIKKAREMRPYKTNTIPIMIDWDESPFEKTSLIEKKQQLHEVIETLPKKHQDILNKTYGFKGEKPKAVKELISEMGITRPQYSKILKEAKDKIKEQLKHQEKI